MKRFFTSHQRYNASDYFLIGLVFTVVIVYCLASSPLSFPDTNTYLKAHIYRFPGYIYFLRGIRFIFQDSYELAVVVCQLLFGLSAVFFSHKILSKLFSLPPFWRLLLLLLLVFPFFEPFLVANKLVSEGLAYPLYLLLMSHALLLLKNEHKNALWIVVGSYILLVLTRGQFVIVAPILFVVFLLKYRTAVFMRKNLWVLSILLVLPIITNLIDRTHRELVYDYFETTPFSFVNAITLPLYVSEENDTSVFDSEVQQRIFELTYHRMDSMDLLAHEVEGDSRDKYLRFHENFPQICNQNFHEQGRNYLDSIYPAPYASSIQIEEESKAMFVALLKDNQDEWLELYVEGIKYGFKSIVLLIFVCLVFIWSGVQSLRKFDFTYSTLFLSSSLLLSNAMVTALASHSIQRYLFYNYFLGFIIVILVIRKLTQLYETRSLGGDALPQ